MGVLFGGACKGQRIAGPRAIEGGMRLLLPLLKLQIGEMLARAGTLHRHALDEGPLTAAAAWPGHSAHRAELPQVAWQARPSARGVLNVVPSSR